MNGKKLGGGGGGCISMAFYDKCDYIHLNVTLFICKIFDFE